MILKRLTGGPVSGRGNVRLAAVVVTATVARAELDPLSVTETGEAEQLPSEGAPVHAKVSVPLRPPSGETLKLYVLSFLPIPRCWWKNPRRLRWRSPYRFPREPKHVGYPGR
jgi:hypothetical protein